MLKQLITKIKNLSTEQILIFKNTFYLMIMQFFSYILPFITLPYLSRILNVSDLGLVFFAQTFMDYFVSFISYGFELSAARLIAIYSYNKKCLNYIFNAVVWVKIGLAVISFIILSSILLLIPKFTKDWLVYLYSFIYVLGYVFQCHWFYQGMAKMKFITLLNVLTRIISLILIFVFIKQPEDYILYPMFNAFAVVLSCIISIIIQKRGFDINFYIPKLRYIWKMVKYSTAFFLSRLSITLYRYTNAIVLGWVVTSTAVAYYVAADKIYWGITCLYGTFIYALLPYMSKHKDTQFFTKMRKYLLLIVIITTLSLLFLSKYLIILFYSYKYISSIKILQIFSLSFPFFIVGDVMGLPLLGAFGYTKETNNGYLLGAIYNVLGLLFLYLINHINICSVAILVSTTYVVMFLHRLYYVNKYKLLK